MESLLFEEYDLLIQILFITIWPFVESKQSDPPFSDPEEQLLNMDDSMRTHIESEDNVSLMAPCELRSMKFES